MVAQTIRRHLPNGGLILLAGLGAAGKSTFALEIARALNGEASVYHGDGFQYKDSYRRTITLPDGTTPTGCHPSAYDKHMLRETVGALRRGEYVSQFDQHGGDPRYPESWKMVGQVEPQKWIIVEGLSTIHEKHCFDLVFFLDCTLEEERRRRFERDIANGKDPKDVEATFDKRRQQYEKYILRYRDECVRLRSQPDYSITLEE